MGLKPGMDGKKMKAMFSKAPAKKAAPKNGKMYRAGEPDEDDQPQKPLKQPLIKPKNKGLLHKKLGVAKGKKIPKGKINKALHSKSKSLRKEANFAKNFGK